MDTSNMHRIGEGSFVEVLKNRETGAVYRRAQKVHGTDPDKGQYYPRLDLEYALLSHIKSERYLHRRRIMYQVEELVPLQAHYSLQRVETWLYPELINILAECWRNGIVVADLSYANVMTSKNGKRLIISDLNCAYLDTVTGLIAQAPVCTLDYRPPEYPDKELTFFSVTMEGDLYSLGKVLKRALGKMTCYPSWVRSLLDPVPENRWRHIRSVARDTSLMLPIPCVPLKTWDKIVNHFCASVGHDGTSNSMRAAASTIYLALVYCQLNPDTNPSICLEVAEAMVLFNIIDDVPEHYAVSITTPTTLPYHRVLLAGPSYDETLYHHILDTFTAYPPGTLTVDEERDLVSRIKERSCAVVFIDWTLDTCPTKLEWQGARSCREFALHSPLWICRPCLVHRFGRLMNQCTWQGHFGSLCPMAVDLVSSPPWLLHCSCICSVYRF